MVLECFVGFVDVCVGVVWVVGGNCGVVSGIFVFGGYYGFGLMIVGVKE